MLKYPMKTIVVMLHKVSEKEQSIMQLNADDLIELAETGKTGNIELDSIAKIVLHECSNMLEFEADYYEREKKRNAR